MRLRRFLAVTVLLIAGGSLWIRWGTTRPAASEARDTLPQTRLAARKDSLEKSAITGKLVRPANSFEEELERTWSAAKSESKVLELVRGKGLSDPLAAMGALLKQPSGHLRIQALLVLIEEWARKDPPGAAAAILQKCQAQDLDRLLGQVVGVWIIASPDACLAWLDSQLSDPALKALQFQHAYAVWAGDSPENALAGLVGASRKAANLRAVFATFANSDFPTAVERYKLLPAHEQSSLQETLILIGAAEGETEVDHLLADFLKTHEGENERIQLGRNLVSIDQGLALQVVESGSSDEQKKRIKDRVFSGVAVEGSDDLDAVPTEMMGKPVVTGAGKKPTIDGLIPTVGLPKKQPLANEATR